MKFRSYQIFFIISIVLIVVALCMPVLQLVEPNGATALLNNFSLLQPDGSKSYVVCALGGVLIFTALVNLFTLIVSSFQNFELQKRCSILGVILLTGYYVLLLIVSLLLIEGVSVVMQIAVLFPFIALILNVLSFMSIRRTEASILAKAAGFRLRD